MNGNEKAYDKCGSNESESRLIGLGFQRPYRMIASYDISRGEMNDPVFSYKSSFCHTVSGFKLRNIAPYGDVVLITGGVTSEMVSCDTKEVIWSTDRSPENAHSIELLPNGIIAVAGSSGNAVRFFNINGSSPADHLLSLDYNDAHGVLWDPKYNVLWCAGNNSLFAYEVTLNADGTVTLLKNEALSVVTPDGSLHDLQAYTGEPDLLIITTVDHVYCYNKAEKTFTDAYTDVEGAKTRWIRSAGVFANGDLVYTEHDGGDDNGHGGGWNTTLVHYIDGDSRTLSTVSTTQGRFYKCRVWSSSYQP